MKKSKKSKSIAKGAPSGLMISLLVHAGAFVLAGLLVVFTMVKKEEVTFTPPPAVERPKMKLKKPKVKVKKTAKPASPTRIIAKLNKADMPDLQLPELGGEGTGSGFGGIDALGGFGTMPDLDGVTVFGAGQSIGNDFEGTFYDFKRTRRGTVAMAMDSAKYNEVVGDFIRSGWKKSKLARFYQSPKKLYTTSFMVAGVPSDFGPWAFGEPEIAGYNFLLHYTGQIVYPEGGRFRFWGMGDNVLVVRVGGEVVFDMWDQFQFAHDGKASKPSGYHMAYWPAYYGPWFDLEPGVSLDMEVIFGETAGGLSSVMLCIEQEGVDYPENFESAPMLPIFKTARLSLDEVDAIYEYLMEDNYSVTNGPIFNDYGRSDQDRPVAQVAESAAAIDPVEVAPQSSSRIWTLKSGKTVEAELVVKMGDKLVLKTARGKTVKVPVIEFSAEDLDYVELESPPQLKVTFQKDIGHFQFKALPIVSIPPAVEELTCGVKIEKISRSPYTRELKVELFTFANEIDGKNYILLDRQERRFTFDEQTGTVFKFMGQMVYLRNYLDGMDYKRGERLAGRMILVTDERGEIIAQLVSNPWMLEHLEFIRTFPVGRHLSDEGKRVHPPRAKLNDRHWGMTGG
jgi:hypothetical protein